MLLTLLREVQGLQETKLDIRSYKCDVGYRLQEVQRFLPRMRELDSNVRKASVVVHEAVKLLL